MARRKKGRAVHGWIALDKPIGMTSTQAVSTVRRLFDARKAGHAGTLDPLATGILPIAMGEATKTVPYAVEGEKSYRFTVRWGQQTDTDDAEGRPVATSDARPDRVAIETLLAQFIGNIQQTPPTFSAIKIQGERAYDLARAGEAVDLEARTVRIDAFELVDIPSRDSAVFEARCGKGTYVRALARDMGRALDCFGHVTALRRTQVASFVEAEAVSMDDLQAASEEGPESLQRLLMPVESALSALTVLRIGQNEAARLLQGQSVIIRGRDAPASSGPTYATCKGHLIAVGRIERGEMHPLRVFNFGPG